MNYGLKMTMTFYAQMWGPDYVMAWKNSKYKVS